MLLHKMYAMGGSNIVERIFEGVRKGKFAKL